PRRGRPPWGGAPRLPPVRRPHGRDRRRGNVVPGRLARFKAALTPCRHARRVETFVIRLWRPAEPEHDGAGRLRGVVECVRLGEHRPFDGGAELLAFLETAVTTPTQRTANERMSR